MNALEIPAGTNSESATSQCSRLLAYLKTHGTLTTVDARQVMGIMNPAQRISELRNRYQLPIETAWVYAPDETGAVHRMALYVWRGLCRQRGQLPLPGISDE